MENEQSLIQFLQQTLEVEPASGFSLHELEERLAAYVNQLINQDFQRLVGLLYTIDVNENKLKVLLRDNPNADAGKIIASLIIERQLQKIKTRHEFKDSMNEAGEEEKW